MECAIPLTTKSWEIDYGTLRSLPDSGFIEEIHQDSDGKFVFYCKSENRDFVFGLRNLPEKFDYTIVTFGLSYLVKPILNSVFRLSANELFCRQNTHFFSNQKLKVSYNFFFYEKLDSSMVEKMREFIHRKYDYSTSEIHRPLRSSPSMVSLTSESSVEDSMNLNFANTVASPFKCDVAFYINSLNPTLPKPSQEVITSGDMVRMLKLPDGTLATICKMEFFMEESIKHFNFDEDALKLYQQFKSIDDHQICTGCPKKLEVTLCNIWQVNYKGYYLCSKCCLGLDRACRGHGIQHRCHVPTDELKDRFRSMPSGGFCSRCLFYYNPCDPKMPHKKFRNCMIRSPNNKIVNKPSRFFKLLTLDDYQNQIPDFDAWVYQVKKSDEIPAIKKYESDIFDIHGKSFSDIVTIKDVEKLPTKNEDTEMQPEITKDDGENDGWEIADPKTETNSETSENGNFVV